MHDRFEATLQQLQLTHRAFALSRDRAEAGHRLRRVVDDARRLLAHQPAPYPDEHVRQLYMPLHSHTILAEASLHGHPSGA